MSGGLRSAAGWNAAFRARSRGYRHGYGPSACASTIRGGSATCCGPTAIRYNHKLLKSLGPEPLSDEFNGEYLAQARRGLQQLPIKQFIMNGQVVVGVGNIYASEALFRS